MVAPKRRFFVPVLPAVGLAAVAAGPVLQALGSSGPANSVSASLATTHGSGDDGPEAGAPAGHGTPPSKGDDGHGRTIRKPYHKPKPGPSPQGHKPGDPTTTLDPPTTAGPTTTTTAPPPKAPPSTTTTTAAPTTTTAAPTTTTAAPTTTTAPLTAWKWTGGRYDPTVLHAIEAAGYDRSFEQIEAHRPAGSGKAMPAPGCAGVVLDPHLRTVTLPPGVGFDPGGIGKGLAADLVVDLLLEEGAAGACVDLGGDGRAAGGRLAGGRGQPLRA